MNKKVKVVSAVSAALALTPFLTAGAAESGFYIGATVGQSQMDVSKDDLDWLVTEILPVVEGESSLDDSDTAFSGLVGYRFGKHIAVEAAYVDLGETRYRASGLLDTGDGFIDADLDLDIGATGPALSVLGLLPVGQNWDLYARLGVFFADVEAGVSLTDGFESASESVSDSGEEFFYGVGAAYNFAQRFAVRAEFTQYKDVGNEESVGEADVNLLSLGVTYTF